MGRVLLNPGEFPDGSWFCEPQHMAKLNVPEPRNTPTVTARTAADTAAVRGLTRFYSRPNGQPRFIKIIGQWWSRIGEIPLGHVRVLYPFN